jgi:hypothetical protein
LKGEGQSLGLDSRLCKLYLISPLFLTVAAIIARRGQMSDIEADQDHIAILHHVVAAFLAEPARLAGRIPVTKL